MENVPKTEGNQINPTVASEMPQPVINPSTQVSPMPEPNLGNNQNQKQFMAIILGLIGIIILIAVLVGGYLFFIKEKNKPIVNSQQSVPQSSSSVITPIVSTNQKTYCDNQAKLCFKYPNDWKAQDQSNNSILGSIVAQNIQSPDNTMNAIYMNAPSNLSTKFSTSTSPGNINSTNTQNASMTDLYVVAIDNMESSSSPYKVIEGYIISANNNTPSIWLADASVVNTYSLQAGKTSRVQIPFPFTVTNLTGRQVIFSAGPISNNLFSPTQAQAWFNMSNTKTMVQILESLYPQ